LSTFTIEELRLLADKYVGTLGEEGSIGMLDDGTAIEDFLDWIEEQKKESK
jgi:hypothetical protein